MKAFRSSNLLVLSVAGSLCAGSLNARADLEVGASVSISATADFDAPLSECGTWVEVGTYGRCWRPSGVVVGWRPYCDGHWEWTDCGWYWVSDERWAWACYHYGYWVWDPGFGWVWIPGIEWGPAWVSWRMGGGYIGWAPLAPRHVSVVSAHFVFVHEGRLRDRHRSSTVIVNNTTVINKTKVINNGMRREDRTIGGATRRNVVVNEGPGVAVVEKASGKKLKAAPIQEVARQTPVPEQVLRSRGKAANRQLEETPAKSIDPNSKARETPVPRKQPGAQDADKRLQPNKERDKGRPAPPVKERPRQQQPSIPDSDKRLEPDKERGPGKPSPPDPERPAPRHAPEQKVPGVDRRPGPGGLGPQPPPQRPQGPPARESQRPPEKEKGQDTGGREKQGKRDKDQP